MFRRTKKQVAGGQAAAPVTESGMDLSGFVSADPPVQIAVELGPEDAEVYVRDGGSYRHLYLAALATVTLTVGFIRSRLDHPSQDDRDPDSAVFWRKALLDGPPAALNASVNPGGVREVRTAWSGRGQPFFFTTESVDPSVGSAAMPHFNRPVSDVEALRVACALYGFVDSKGGANVPYQALRYLAELEFKHERLADVFVLPDKLLENAIELHVEQRSRAGAQAVGFGLTETVSRAGDVISRRTRQLSFTPNGKTDVVVGFLETMVKASKFGDWLPIGEESGDGLPVFRGREQRVTSVDADLFEEDVEYTATLDEGWDPFLVQKARLHLLNIWAGNHYHEITADLSPEELADLESELERRSRERPHQ